MITNNENNQNNNERENEPEDLPIVGNGENEANGQEEEVLSDQEQATGKKIEEKEEMQVRSLEESEKEDEFKKDLSDFIRMSKDGIYNIDSSTRETSSILKFFIPVSLVLISIILILCILIYRTERQVLKKVEFFLRQDVGFTSGIIQDKKDGKLIMMAYDITSDQKKTLVLSYDDFSNFSNINLNFCSVWKDHKEEMGRLMPRRPWYPTAMLYVLQWLSLSPGIYPPFPCANQVISDKGIIYESKIGFGNLKKGDYAVVRINNKDGNPYITKIWKIEPTFLMPLLTDKQ